MSSPTSSLHSSPPNDEQPASPPSEVPAAPEQENLLHLAPRTWEEFLRIEPPATGLYEYVDGYVIWCPLMADADHVSTSHSHSNVLSCSREIIIVHTPSIELVNDRDRTQRTIDHEEPPRMQTRQSTARDRDRGSSSRDPHRASSSSDPHRASSNRASSSRDPATIQSDMRHPDFAIMKPKADSTDNSDTSRDPLAKKRIYFALPLTKYLLALVEITSHSTRSTDLNAKWNSYARSNVPMYIIVDRGTESGGNKRIIVGTLEPLGSGTLQSTSGDKHVAPPARSSRITRRHRPRYPPRYYYRKVYRGNDIVDCPYYGELRLKARDLLDVGFMDALSTRMGNEEGRRRRRAQVVEQELSNERRKTSDLTSKNAAVEQELSNERRKTSDLTSKNAALSSKNAAVEQDLSNERRKTSDLTSKYDKALRKIDEYERKEKAEKNSRGGSSSKSNSPEHKKSRRQG